MVYHPQFNLIHDNTLRILIITLILLLILFFVNLYHLMNKIGAEQVISSGANVTKLTDAIDIKKRMKFHGCLVCRKDSAGVWWFNKDGKQCELWSPEQQIEEEI